MHRSARIAPVALRPIRGVRATIFLIRTVLTAILADGKADNTFALSQTKPTYTIAVPPRRINEIVLGKRAITADTDLRLARYFKMSEGFFLGLQTDHELMERKRQIGDQLKAIRPRAA